MAKFKVGDKVRILNGSKIQDYTGNWNEDMRKYVGEIYTIERPLKSGGKNLYRLKHNIYVWDERGLALVRENKFKVGDIVVGNDGADLTYGVTKKGVKGKVICKCDDDGKIEIKVVEGRHRGQQFCVYPECFDLVNEEITIKQYGNKVVAKYGDKTAVAKCSPEDTFDFATGARLAFERLMSVEEKPAFTKNDLKTGMFVLMSDGDFGVVVNDIIVYEKSGYDVISHLDDNLSYANYKINAIVLAKSFGDAKFIIEHNNTPKIVWRRNTK